MSCFVVIALSITSLPKGVLRVMRAFCQAFSTRTGIPVLQLPAAQ